MQAFIFRHTLTLQRIDRNGWAAWSSTRAECQVKSCAFVRAGSD